MAEIAFREALRLTLREELLADERVIFMGEDIGAYGGSYAVTKGFQQEFGAEREFSIGSKGSSSRDAGMDL